MVQVIQTSQLIPVITAAQRVLCLVENGQLFHQESEADTDKVVADIDRLQEAVDGAVRAIAAAVDGTSPFLRHRKAILGRREMQRLVLFLFGGDRCNFFTLFSSTTEEETAIALEMIASYAELGENDEHFMRLAAEIHDLQKAAA